MAEIPIERKKGPNWLLWLLPLLALLLLGYCFTRRRPADVVDSLGARADTIGAAGAATGSTTGAAGTAGAAGAAAATGAAGGVDQFVQFVQQRDTSNETEGQHRYTAEGVRRLATALEGIANNNPSIQVYADSMRRSVDRLQQSGANDVHADDAKAAFNAAVSAMAAIDKARGTTRDVAPMRAIAGELSGSRPLLPQLGVVHRFFEAARDALGSMR